jgi:tRNA threonylcarbamoyladenosine biosynthesis protein TsaB
MLLAIETATRAGSIALWSEAGLVHFEELGPDPNSTLAATVERALAGRWSALRGYAVSIGPGSFTGLRIGLAFVKGLAAARPLGVIPIPTLEILAAEIFAQGGQRSALAALDAKKEELYAALYSPGLTIDPVLPRGLYAATEVIARLADRSIDAGGDGATILPPPGSWRIVQARPTASRLAELAYPRMTRGEGVASRSVELLYDQPAAAEKNLASAVGRV